MWADCRRRWCVRIRALFKLPLPPVLGTELKTSHVLPKGSTTELHPLALGVFNAKTGSSKVSQASLGLVLLLPQATE